MTLFPSPYTLYAYDPGGTTGWASFLVYPAEKRAALAQWGEHKLWEGIDAEIGSPYCQEVVYEHIVPRAVDFNPIGLQVIGVIRYLCERHGIAVRTQSNAVLRGIERWGIYDLTLVKSLHARDAAMHGIVFLRKQGYDIVLGILRRV